MTISVSTTDARPSTSILVVEDDYFVRDLLEIGLAGPGRRLLVAGSGAEALALGRPQHIDLLVADVILPDLSGPGVAAALRFKHPDMQILYISGWYDQPNFPDLEGEHLLMKPFGLDDLRLAVTAQLDRLPTYS